MKALCYSKKRGLHLAEKEIPSPKKGEVLLKVLACTICGSDLRVVRGEKEVKRDGVTLGHEIWGKVVESRNSALKEGEQLSLFPSIFCKRCEPCLKGAVNLCKNKLSFGSALDGGFAEYLLIPEELLNIGGFVKTKREGLANCLIEPLGCVIRSLEILQPRDNLLILGAGPLGLMHLIVADAHNISVSIVDRNPHRRAFAEKLCKKCKSFASLSEVEESFSAAVMCAPAFGELDRIVELVKERGRVNLFAGGSWEAKSGITPNLIHYREIILTGTHSTTPESFKKAGELSLRIWNKLQGLITHIYPLTAYTEAFKAYETRRALKVALIPHKDIA